MPQIWKHRRTGSHPTMHVNPQWAIQKSQGSLQRKEPNSAVSDFSKLAAEHDESELEWTSELELNKQTGVIKSTIDNIWLILRTTRTSKASLQWMSLLAEAKFLSPEPWSAFEKRRAWTDNDNQGLYWYFEKIYSITGNGKIDGALSLHSEKHSSMILKTS